jgi:hypothetical protein
MRGTTAFVNHFPELHSMSPKEASLVFWSAGSSLLESTALTAVLLLELGHKDVHADVLQLPAVVLQRPPAVSTAGAYSPKDRGRACGSGPWESLLVKLAD